MKNAITAVFAIGLMAAACSNGEATPTPSPTPGQPIGTVSWVMDEFDIPVERCEVDADGERCRPVKTNVAGSTIEGPSWEEDCRALQATYDEIGDSFAADRLRARSCPNW